MGLGGGGVGGWGGCELGGMMVDLGMCCWIYLWDWLGCVNGCLHGLDLGVFLWVSGVYFWGWGGIIFGFAGQCGCVVGYLCCMVWWGVVAVGEVVVFGGVMWVLFCGGCYLVWWMFGGVG